MPHWYDSKNARMITRLFHLKYTNRIYWFNWKAYKLFEDFESTKQKLINQPKQNQYGLPTRNDKQYYR